MKDNKSQKNGDKQSQIENYQERGIDVLEKSLNLSELQILNQKDRTTLPHTLQTKKDGCKTSWKYIKVSSRKYDGKTQG